MTFTIDTYFPPAMPDRIAQGDGSGFARHNIKHLSASSLNLWINAPDVWVARYLLGHKSMFGSAPTRGLCVEQAVFDTLHGMDADEAIAKAESRFDATDMRHEDQAETEKQRAMIDPMARLALDALAPYGTPDQAHGDEQERIQIRAAFDGWSIPVIGYLDFQFPEHGLVVDLKTTTRMPSIMSAEHQLQRAFYDAATGNSAVKFLYVTPKKAEMREDGNTAEILARAKIQIARLDRFLSACATPEQARAIVPVNPASFYWKGEGDALARIYGL